MHRYLYGWNRPTFYIDPDGHDVRGALNWTKDFIVAAASDLAQNGVDRAVRIAGATVEQAVDMGAETFYMAGDTVNLALGRDVPLASKLAHATGQRLARGDSVKDIIQDSAIDIGANALTVGTYGTLKEQFSTAADYMSGNASIEDVETRLINAAGGAVLNAGLGSLGAKAAGEGWMGKPLSAPTPASVVESVTQIPSMLKADLALTKARWAAAAERVGEVLRSDVTYDPSYAGSGFGALQGLGLKAPGKASPTIEFNVAPHGAQPKPSRPFASHHGISKKTLKQNVPGYDAKADWTIMLEDSAGGPHRSITGQQATVRATSRRALGDPHGGDYGQWRTNAIDQMRGRGVPEPKILEWMLQHEGYMFDIGVPWQKR